MKTDFTLLPQGDHGVLVLFPPQISPEINARVIALSKALGVGHHRGIVSTIPAYRSLLVEYDPRLLSYRKAASLIRHTPYRVTGSTASRLVEIPVRYGKDDGPDLVTVAQHAGLTPEEVIRRHSAPTYHVYMLGFRPGFPYLGGLDPQLNTPRLPSPREKIPAGSVGIAGSQTGIYPEISPGGWNLIGKTLVCLYDPAKGALLHPGDQLKFIPVEEGTEAPSMPVIHTIADAGDTSDPSDPAASNTHVNASSWNATLTPLPEPAAKGLSFPSSVLILQKGLLTIPVCLKRHFQESMGVSTGGPMDSLSHRLANELVGKSPEAETLESLLVLPQLQFQEDGFLAITGGTGDYRLERAGSIHPITNGQPVPIQAGDILKSSPILRGCRSYIAFAPAFTDDNSLKVHSAVSSWRQKRREKALTFPLPCHDKITVLRVIRGVHSDAFSAEGLKTFYESTYTYSPQSNRMGIRFLGEKVSFADGQDGNIISEATLMGDIQVTSEGLPILMMADSQTVGGYTKIGHVILEDLPLAGQLRPGARVRFREISVPKAISLWRKRS